ncbi:unnamed protein product [Hermetia illucens]|uniref:Uncharacterized protein n=1 Tax=Hermetia illucens TaxID=343691 RepID=A0A7R8UTV9_HERIL|nr:PR domain zinc finger protein 5 isoform X2 [Hermetia illucens]CAD7086984.1 unnamed protein product [Hermetia illucens]
MDFMPAKNLELDKICRVCLAAKKDMRPLFGEMVADMLMECARVQIDNTDGWPDKICVQCVHQVSRCHAFKTRVEKSDRELRNYIKKLTVIVEEPITQLPTSNCNDITLKNLQTRHVPNTVQANDVTTQMVISNGQLHNAHILNAAQIVTHNGQHVAQIVNAGQIGQLLQSGSTVQMIHPNGQQTQVVHIQPSSETPCEIIVQPDLDDDDDETHFLESVEVSEAITTEEVDQDDIIQIHEEVEEEVKHEPKPDEEEEIVSDEIAFALDISDDSDADEKMYLAEFISLQTSCPSPGRYVCNLCRKEFKHSRWIQNHMKSHSNWIKANCKRQPQCEICHRSFKGPGMLKMHMKTHETADRAPVCTICNKEFKSKTILYRHRQTHQMKSYQCGHCLRPFTSSYTLASHMTKKHANSEHTRKYKCAHCDEIHTNIDDLKKHIQTAGHIARESKADENNAMACNENVKMESITTS